MSHTYSNHNTNASQQSQLNSRPQFITQFPPNMQNGPFPAIPQPIYFYHCDLNQNHGYVPPNSVAPSNMIDPGAIARNPECGMFQNVLQNLVGRKPEDTFKESFVKNEQSQDTDLKNCFMKTVNETPPQIGLQDMKSLFIDVISAAAHRGGGCQPANLVQEKENVEELIISQKIENGAINEHEEDKIISKTTISSSESLIQATEELKKCSDHSKDVPKILQVDNSLPIAIQTVKSVSHDKKDENTLLPVSKISKSGNSRISYALGDLLEYSNCKESLTLKSLNAITKYVISLVTRGPRSKKVSYKRSDNSFISHKERISGLSDSQALIEKFKIVIRTSLNKLTAQNILYVHDELSVVKFNNPEHADFISTALVRSVSKNSLLIVHYAHLTAKLLESIAKMDDKATTEMLKNKILEKCFKNLAVDQEWLDSYNILKSRKITTLSEHDILNEELLETEETQRKKHIGTITFLSHLLKLRVYGPDISLKIIDVLVLDTHEFLIEMLCKYLTVYGMELEELNKGKVNEVFDRIIQIIPNCSRRIQFLLEDVVALRQDHWRTTSSEFQTRKITPLKKSETSVNYTPQRFNNGSNKPNVMVFNAPSFSSKRSEMNKQQTNYSGSGKYGGRGFINIRQNKYGSLANDVSDPSEIQNSYSRKQTSSQKISDSQSLQRSSKSITVKSYSTTDESLFTSPQIAPVDTPTSSISSNDNYDELKKTLVPIINEYFVTLDTSVILGRITEIDCIQYMKFFVEVALTFFIEKNTGHRFLGDLLVVFFKQKRIDKSSFIIGFQNFCVYANNVDLEVDVPKLWNFVASAICPLVYSGDLTICEYMELIVSSGHTNPDEVLQELLNVILKTTSKRTLCLICKNEEFSKIYRRSNKLKEAFPFLDDSLDSFNSEVSLQQVFSQQYLISTNSQVYTFEKDTVNLDSVSDFSRIIFSKCPSGPYELIKSYTEEVSIILKETSFSSLSSSFLIHFFSVLCDCVKEQNKNPSSLISLLIKCLRTSKILDDDHIHLIKSSSAYLDLFS